MKKINISITEPCLEKVVEVVIAAHKPSDSNDFSNDIIVLPGSRSGRRVLELFCDTTELKSPLFSPPRFLTPGSFCEFLLADEEESFSIASDVEEIFAWFLAMQKETASFELLLNRSVSKTYNYLPFAVTVRQIYKELAGDLIFFEDVARNVVENDREVERWSSLSKIYSSYLKILESKNLTDKATAINQILNSDDKSKSFEKFSSLENIFVVGVVDMFERFRATIKFLTEKVTVFSYGKAEWFDDEGGLLPDVSFEKLDENFTKKIKFAATNSNQAKNVVKFLGSLDGNYSCSDIIISAPDDSIRQPLQQQLSEANVKSHDSVGSVFSQTELGILLKTVADYLTDKSVKNFLKIINHPAFQTFFFETNDKFSEFTKSFVIFSSDHIITEIESEMYVQFELKEKIAEVEEFFSCFSKENSIKNCLEKINEILSGVYEKNSYLENLENQPQHHLEGIKKWNELSDRISDSAIELKDKKDFSQTIKLMLQLLSSEKLAPKAETNTIDIIGWLEVPLDDAPVVILTGMNEGIVPKSQTSHIFLPNSLRKSLGVQNNNRRFSRDKYYLRTIIQATKELYITAGKFSDNQDPLLPSRLLLDIKETEQAKLLQGFTKIKSNENKFISSNQPIICKISDDENLFLSDPEMGKSLSVTSFKTYLNCPYRFYLEKEKKYPTKELQREMPAYEYGNVVHKALELFGISKFSNSKVFSEIQKYLKMIVDTEIEKRFGGNPHTAVLLQKDSIINRLNIFAKRQTERVELGWEIIDTEKKFEIKLDNYKITGKIDRIDKKHNQKYIIDYKTGPIKSNELHTIHYDKKKEKWKDLQLPLYAYWGQKEFDETLPEVGYFSISKNSKNINLLKYDLDEIILEDAIKTAKKIFRKINSKDKDNFKRTDNLDNCKYCNYKKLCNCDTEIS